MVIGDAMNYPVSTSIQLRAVLRALRRNRGLTQEQAGKLLGVNQKRLAAIEKVPAVTSFDQISRLVTALGGRLAVEIAETSEETKRSAKARKSGAAKKPAPSTETW